MRVVPSCPHVVANDTAQADSQRAARESKGVTSRDDRDSDSDVILLAPKRNCRRRR